MAKRQTEGVGRRGRVWHDGEGNLMASFYQTLDVTYDRISQLAFVVAVSVHQALIGLDPFCQAVQIKWPNDLLWQGRKISGILIETEATPNGLGVIIGIGVNMVHSPQHLDYKTASLNDLVANCPSPETLLDLIDSSLVKNLNQWIKDGFQPFQKLWLDRAYGRAEEVVFKSENKTLYGRVLDLDETGALKLALRDGEIITLTEPV